MRLLARIALLFVSVLALSGCIPQQAAVEPAPTPSATPIFASEEEALAAAEEAYAAYQSAVDSALATHDARKLEDVAIGSALVGANDSVAGFRDAGRRQRGASSIDTVSLVSFDAGSTFVQIYACLDVSVTDVYDESGQSVVSPDRPTRFPMIVELEWEQTAARFLVANEAVWDADDFC